MHSTAPASLQEAGHHHHLPAGSAGGGSSGQLHQSSSCGSLYTLGSLASSSLAEQENIQPGQKRLLYASVGELGSFI